MGIFKAGVQVTSINFHRWKKDLRIAFVLLFTVFLVDYYVGDLVNFALERGENVTFCMLPSLFIDSMSSLRNPKMVLHVGMLVLLCDAPFFHPVTPYAVMRSKRKSWWMGEILYIIGVAFFYISFITIVSTIRMLPAAEFGNEWGSALNALVYGTKEQTVIQILSTIDGKTMIVYQVDAVKYLYPFACQMYTFVTGWATFVVIGLIVYCISLVKKSMAWGMGVAGIVIFSEPVIYWLQKTNVWLHGLNPLCWNTITNLTMTAENGFLTIPYVTVMYIVLIVTLILISWLLSRKATIELR